MPTQNGNDRVYTISTDFTSLGGKPIDLDALDVALSALSLSVTYTNLSVEGAEDRATISTSGAPSVSDEDALDAAVAAHDGVHIPAIRVANYAFLTPTFSVTSATMEDVATLCDNVDDYGVAADLAWCLRGEVKVAGTGFALSMVKADGTPLMSNYVHGDTSSNWETFEFMTSVGLVSGLECYRVQAMLNGATSAEIRGLMLTLLK